MDRNGPQLDPGIQVRQVAPGGGTTVVPHAVTFSGIVSSLARVYSQHDESMLHNPANAAMMRRDPMIMGPLLSRQMAVSLLSWSIVPEDETDPELQEVASAVQDIVGRIPRMTEYVRNLLEAIWYGRHGVQHRWGFERTRSGKRVTLPTHWVPLHGDKLVFRYDDGRGLYDTDQVGIKVTPAWARSNVVKGTPDLEYTREGSVVMLSRWQRARIAIHKHLIMDGDFLDPRTGGMVNGVGLRHFLYWVWYQKQETLAALAETVERTGMGFTIYYYPSGNEQAKAKVEEIAAKQPDSNQIIMPFDPSNPDAYRIEQIPPNTGGIAALQMLLDNYFGNWILRFILGQTLTMRADGTGLGSGLSDLHKDSFLQVIRYDATNVEETLTTDLVRPIVLFNFPRYRSVRFFFKIATESSVPEEKLQALQAAWSMGAELRAQDVMDLLGVSMPQDGERTLYNPGVRGAMLQIAQAQQQAQEPAQQPQEQLPPEYQQLLAQRQSKRSSGQRRFKLTQGDRPHVMSEDGSLGGYIDGDRLEYTHGDPDMVPESDRKAFEGEAIKYAGQFAQLAQTDSLARQIGSLASDAEAGRSFLQSDIGKRRITDGAKAAGYSPELASQPVDVDSIDTHTLAGIGRQATDVGDVVRGDDILSAGPAGTPNRFRDPNNPDSFGSMSGQTGYREYPQRPHEQKPKPSLVTDFDFRSDFDALKMAKGESEGEHLFGPWHKWGVRGESAEDYAKPGRRLFNDPHLPAGEIAKRYIEANRDTIGEAPRPRRITSLDSSRSKAIGDAYASMEHAPNDPKVRAAYAALADESGRQMKALLDAGYKIEMWHGEGEPYANSAEMIKDLDDNKHMWIFPTEGGFGSSGITPEERESNPMLGDSGFKDANGKPMLLNDAFRAVHDFFGHAELGNGFGPVGEENAWQLHSRMFSPEARRALTSETRGQNSWVNFGPHLRREDGSLPTMSDPDWTPPHKRPFADQKNGLLPDDIVFDYDSHQGEPEQHAKLSETMRRAAMRYAKEEPELRQDAPELSSEELLSSESLPEVEPSTQYKPLPWQSKEGRGQEDHVLLATRSARSLMDPKKVRLTDDEQSMLSDIMSQRGAKKAFEKWLKQNPDGTESQFASDVEASIRSTKSRFPTSEGWVSHDLWQFNGFGSNGEPEFKEVGYRFADRGDGKAWNINEVGSREYKQSVRTIGNRVAREVQDVYQRAKSGDTTAQKILGQAKWYAEMRRRLRTEFGGFGDLFADLLGATSPNTIVRDNWRYASDLLSRAFRGDFDAQMPTWEAWADELTSEVMKRDNIMFQLTSRHGMSQEAARETDEWKKANQKVSSLRAEAKELMPRRNEEGDDGQWKKYGFNGDGALFALVNTWRAFQERGDKDAAPKALNFAGNLIGFSDAATIDVWAARMLQRLYSTKKGGRYIPPPAEGGVGGRRRADGETSGAFRFGQDAFAHAVNVLRKHPELGQHAEFAKMGNDDLQALVWFLEKEHWTNKDFTSASGEGGSFEQMADIEGVADQDKIKEYESVLNRTTLKPKELPEELRAQAKSLQRDIKASVGKKRSALQAAYADLVGETLQGMKQRALQSIADMANPVNRFIGGISEQRSGYVPDDEAMTNAQAKLINAAYSGENPVNSVRAMRAYSTIGKYGDPERSIDLELVARSDYDPMPIRDQVFKIAKEADQDSAFFAKVIQGDDVDPLLHRPGIEIYFRDTDDIDAIAAKVDHLMAMSQNAVGGFTVVTDGRPGTRQRLGRQMRGVGLRALVLPEIDARWNSHVADQIGTMSDTELAEELRARRRALAAFASRVMREMPEVSTAFASWYEVESRFRGEYDAKPNRAVGAGSEGRNRGSWGGRSVRDAVAAAVAGNEGAGGEEGGRGGTAGKPDRHARRVSRRPQRYAGLNPNPKSRTIDWESLQRIVADHLGMDRDDPAWGDSHRRLMELLREQGFPSYAAYADRVASDPTAPREQYEWAVSSPIYAMQSYSVDRGPGRSPVSGRSWSVNENELAGSPAWRKWAGKAAGNIAHRFPHAGDDEDHSDRIQTGVPVVVAAHHGSPPEERDTPKRIDFFDDSRLGSESGARSALHGHFFSVGPHTAESYRSEDSIAPGRGGSIERYFVRMHNPYVVDLGNDMREMGQYDDIIRSAKKAGHDGVVIKNTADAQGDQVPDHVVVSFNPSSIKHVENMAPTEDVRVDYAKPGALDDVQPVRNRRRRRPGRYLKAFESESWFLPDGTLLPVRGGAFEGRASRPQHDDHVHDELRRRLADVATGEEPLKKAGSWPLYTMKHGVPTEDHAEQAGLPREAAQWANYRTPRAAGQPDLRKFAIEDWGWTRHSKNTIETSGLSRSKLKAIAKGLETATSREQHKDLADRQDFDLYDVSSKKWFRNVPIDVFRYGDTKSLRDYQEGHYAEDGEPERYAEDGGLTLFRAADDGDIQTGHSFSEDQSTAEAYLDNPGFGGERLWSTKVRPKSVLDLSGSDDPWEEISELLGESYEPKHHAYHFPGFICTDDDVHDRLADLGYDWVRFDDDYPEGGVTMIPVHPDAAAEAKSNISDISDQYRKDGHYAEDGEPERYAEDERSTDEIHGVEAVHYPTSEIEQYFRIGHDPHGQKWQIDDDGFRVDGPGQTTDSHEQTFGLDKSPAFRGRFSGHGGPYASLLVMDPSIRKIPAWVIRELRKHRPDLSQIRVFGGDYEPTPRRHFISYPRRKDDGAPSKYAEDGEPERYAEHGGVSIVPYEDWSKWDRGHEPDDNAVFHVTSEPAAKRILETGKLIPGSMSGNRVAGRGGYAGHSKGRVFFTEKAGVPFWSSRVEDHLFDQHDDPPEVAVLRIPRSLIAGKMHDDEAGSRDTPHRAWFHEGPVELGKPEHYSSGESQLDLPFGDEGEPSPEPVKADAPEAKPARVRVSQAPQRRPGMSPEDMREETEERQAVKLEGRGELQYRPPKVESPPSYDDDVIEYEPGDDVPAAEETALTAPATAGAEPPEYEQPEVVDEADASGPRRTKGEIESGRRAAEEEAAKREAWDREDRERVEAEDEAGMEQEALKADIIDFMGRVPATVGSESEGRKWVHRHLADLGEDHQLFGLDWVPSSDHDEGGYYTDGNRDYTVSDLTRMFGWKRVGGEVRDAFNAKNEQWQPARELADKLGMKLPTTRPLNDEDRRQISKHLTQLAANLGADFSKVKPEYQMQHAMKHLEGMLPEMRNWIAQAKMAGFKGRGSDLYDTANQASGWLFDAAKEAGFDDDPEKPKWEQVYEAAKFLDDKRASEAAESGKPQPQSELSALVNNKTILMVVGMLMLWHFLSYGRRR